MKKIHLLILMLLLAAGVDAQQYVVDFEYDDAGNRERRIRREITIPPPSEQTENISEEEIKEQLAKTENEFGFDALAGGQIKVFPNPVNDELRIRLENIRNIEGTEVSLYNTTGKMLKSQKVNNSYSTFDMSAYSPGIYILRISKNKEYKEYKIVKK